MKPSRRQLGTTLLVRTGVQLLFLNALGFILAFSVLSASSTRVMDAPVDHPLNAEPPRPDAREYKSWFRSINISEKTRALPPCYVMENGLARHLTITEWATWKLKAAVWFQDIGFQGFLTICDDLFKLQPNGTFAPLYVGAAPISAILRDADLQRHVLELQRLSYRTRGLSRTRLRSGSFQTTLQT